MCAIELNFFLIAQKCTIFLFCSVSFCLVFNYPYRSVANFKFPDGLKCIMFFLNIFDSKMPIIHRFAEFWPILNAFDLISKTEVINKQKLLSGQQLYCNCNS